MTYTYFIHGADGRVGSAIRKGCVKEGWTPAPETAAQIYFDCGAPGLHGYGPATWQNYFESVKRAVINIDECERNGALALVLCSTPWVSVRALDPYADTKMLIEQIAAAHNRHGRCFVMVDRIGAQTFPGERGLDEGPRFERSVYQREGELAERVIASVLYAIESRRPQT